MPASTPTIHLIAGCNGAGKLLQISFCRGVRKGGHNVPAADIRRRFKRSLVNLLDDYLPLATRWIVWDSRGLPAKRLAISGENDIESVRKLIGV